MGRMGLATARSVPDLAPRGHTQEDLEAAAANKDTVALLAEALALGPRSVEAAFHCRLHPNVPVERRTLHELGGYYLVSLGPEGRRPGGGCGGPQVTEPALCSPTPRAPSTEAWA